QHLETVADPDRRPAGARMLAYRVHHRREARDRARAQVVAVGEPTGNDDRVHALRRVVTVPQQFGLHAQPLERVLHVELAIRPRKHDDADPNRHEMTISYASITGFASNRSHISFTCARAVSASGASTVNRMVLPMCTCVTFV